MLAFNGSHLWLPAEDCPRLLGATLPKNALECMHYAHLSSSIANDYSTLAELLCLHLGAITSLGRIHARKYSIELG